VSKEKAHKCAFDVLKELEFLDIEFEPAVKGSTPKQLNDKKVQVSVMSYPPYIEFELHGIIENGTNLTRKYENHQIIKRLLSALNRRLQNCIKE